MSTVLNLPANWQRVSFCNYNYTKYNSQKKHDVGLHFKATASFHSGEGLSSSLTKERSYLNSKTIKFSRIWQLLTVLDKTIFLSFETPATVFQKIQFG